MTEAEVRNMSKEEMERRIKAFFAQLRIVNGVFIPKEGASKNVCSFCERMNKWKKSESDGR